MMFGSTKTLIVVYKDELLLKKLKKMGFKIYIASNSIKARVKPFHEELKVDYICHVKKPNPQTTQKQT